jgi:multisubunit Na+/H+ antiporter MnhF subunit
MNAWLIATLALVPPFAVTLALTIFGSVAQRLVAFQAGSSLLVAMLLLLAMANDQPSFLDLPLVLAVTGLPGSLLYANFLERWL